MDKWLVVARLNQGMRRKLILEFGNFSGRVERSKKEAGLGKLSDLYHKWGVRVITVWDSNYPESLREIADLPVALFCQGRLIGKGEVIAAMIGSRAFSDRGREAVKRIVPGLVKAGVVIVSGLAVGIDTLVHEECLRAGGRTIAVLPGGLDEVYPRGNRELAKRIVAGGGCLISEYPLGMKIERKNFLERNRIVSGLSKGVIVVEAAARSGSISTPNFALDQGREVWCVPAKKGEPNSEGVLELMADGAKAVKGVDELVGMV